MSGIEFCTPRKPSQHLLDKIKIPPSPYMKKIGFGTGIAVYELERSPAYNKVRSPWAIKKLLSRARDNAQIKIRLKQEAQTLRKLVHPNIVGFRAYLEGKDVLAMEECSSCLGDLIEDQSDRDAGPFAPKHLVKVSLDVAQALSYLHNTALIMHCDLKSYNVLIKGDFVTCKLCDFGVCLPVNRSGVVDEEKAPGPEYVGTKAWSAPEVLGHPQEITVKADIYSYGLIIWEMIALCPPIEEDLIEDITAYNELDSEELDVLIGKMGCRQRPPIPEDVDLGKDYDPVLEIYYCCTEEDKDKRPEAADLAGILQEMTK